MKNRIIIISSLKKLLIILFLVSFFNSASAQSHERSTLKKREGQQKNKSIEFNIVFKGRGITGINLSDSLGHLFLEFNNWENREAKRNISVSRVSQNQQIVLINGKFIDGSLRSEEYHYLLDSSISKINLIYVDGKTEVVNLKEDTQLNKLAASYYKGILGKNFKAKKIKDLPEYSKHNLLRVLDSMYNEKKKDLITNKRSILNQMNELFHSDILQKIEPFDESVESFAMSINGDAIFGPTIENFFYKYISNRIEIFDYSSLNIQNHSKEYINFISKGLYKYLLQPENLINTSYEDAWSWLKTTDFFDNHEHVITKNISTIKGEGLDSELKNLNILDHSFIHYTLEDIIMLNPDPSEYYLIDFWATWCAPCIDGFRVLKDLKLPDDIGVINLSIDKKSMQDRWKIKSREFELKSSYLIDFENEVDFIKSFLNETIPRYVIVDKHFNIINSNFVQPHDPNFLEYLYKISQTKNQK